MTEELRAIRWPAELILQEVKEVKATVTGVQQTVTELRTVLVGLDNTRAGGLVGDVQDMKMVLVDQAPIIGRANTVNKMLEEACPSFGGKGCHEHTVANDKENPRSWPLWMRVAVGIGVVGGAALGTIWWLLSLLGKGK